MNALSGEIVATCRDHAIFPRTAVHLRSKVVGPAGDARPAHITRSPRPARRARCESTEGSRGGASRRSYRRDPITGSRPNNRGPKTRKQRPYVGRDWYPALNEKPRNKG